MTTGPSCEFCREILGWKSLLVCIPTAVAEDPGLGQVLRGTNYLSTQQNTAIYGKRMSSLS